MSDEDARAHGVCVVISTHQRPAMLREAIASVLAQTQLPEHVIVCSDGYDAETRAVCCEFAGFRPRVILVERPHVGRPSIVRNRALERVELRGSRYVAFCDDDDRWLPSKLKMQREAMEREGWAVLGTRIIPLGTRDESVSADGIREGRRELVGLEDLAAGNRLALSSVMMLTAVWRKLGGFCLGAPTWEDYDLWIRAAVRGAKIGNLGEALVLYRVHDGLSRRETEALRRQALAHIHRHIPLTALRPWGVMAARRVRGVVRLRTRLRQGAWALCGRRRGRAGPKARKA